MKVVILSCGSVAARVAERAIGFAEVDELVVADIDEDAARGLAARTGARPEIFDATEPDSLAKVVEGADVVFNGVGPFYRFALPIIDAVINAGAHYIDICDEFDVAEALVTQSRYDERARAAGVTVLTGCGSAPGTTNLMARMACDRLDRADAVHVVLGLPFIANLGPTILEHMFHSLSGEVTQFLDGEYRKVPAWADRRVFTLLPPLGNREFGYFGHAEPLTLPRFIPGLKEATSRFTWWQEEGNEIYQRLGALGLLSPERSEGVPMSPQAYTARHFCSPEGEAAVQIDVSGEPLIAVFHVRAEGEIDGAPAAVTVESHTGMAELGLEDGADTTAIPAGAFLHRLVKGEVGRTGVLAPEACFDPEPFLREVLPQLGNTLTMRVEQTTPMI